MPKRIAWREVALGVDVGDADTVLSDMKSFKITKSNVMACSDFEPHQSYRLLTFVNRYSQTYLVNNDRVDDLRDWIYARAFTGEEPVTQAFTFGWDLDREGKPTVGNGSNERPLVIGFTTTALIQRLTVPPESFILHVDATYKMNFREYPVLVVELSDRAVSISWLSSLRRRRHNT
uniref:MULE transposase domain-containing protein n=1 Tax=Phytophthora ramorum TaxID=164328 RepID=H3GZH5_PHYRM